MRRAASRLGLALALGAAAAAPAAAAGKAAYQHYLKALLYSNQGQYPEAMREYDAALALDPESETVCEEAARLALQHGDNDRALQLAQRLVTLAPQSAEAEYLLGQVRWARGDGDEARAAFEQALALKPGYGDALFALGNLLSSQSPGDALKYLETYVAQNPDDASQALYQIALLQSRSGDDATAEETLKRAIASDPDDMDARSALGQLYESHHDTEAALGAYQDMLQRDPSNVELIDHVGEIYVLDGKADAAKAMFQRAKAVAPSHPGTCLWLALLAEDAGDFKEAARQVQDSAALPEDAALNLRLSYYLTQAGELKEAVAALEKAEARWPDNEEVAYFLGLGYDDLKETPKAEAMMERVLKLKPGHRDALFQLGALREKAGDIKGAEQAFLPLIQAHPNDAAALNYLGYSLADRGLELPAAEGYIRRAVALSPQDGAYQDSLGWVLHKEGRDQEALPGAAACARLADSQAPAASPRAAWTSETCPRT
ncbi:MAG: tetratricopeptide repeat protein, partial [Elusimicrobia bacterium]|nr:tetratricopeptide repeat protein [Elusimicrobiota bacterium]